MWRAEFFGRRIWLWIVYFIVVVALVLVHYGGEVFGADCDTVTWTAKLWHQRLCKAGYRKPRAHYVKIVTLAAGSEPIGDYCDGRRFVASLLLQLKKLNPSLIVLDKWYLPGLCATPSATAELKNSIELVSNTVPVIIGQDTNTREELSEENSPDLALWDRLKLDSDGEALAESDISVDGTSSQLASPRMACNNWEIPLRWRVYPRLRDIDPKNNKKTISVDTLAFAVAKKFDPDVDELMRTHIEADHGLVSAFMGLNAFHPVTGTQILCGMATTKYDPKTCSSADAPDLPLKGKIVLIGEYGTEDTHPSVLGDVPGFLLQANYIESILDDRYYQLIPRWLEILLTILCFVLIDIVIEQSGSPHVGALRTLVGVAALWAFAHLAIMQWGYYFTFWFPAVLAVAAKWLERLSKMPKKSATHVSAAGVRVER